jgi:hypothetical protein
MEVDEIALAVLQSGEIAHQRDQFARSEAKALAVHVEPLVGAVFVVRRLCNDEWKLDLVTFARTADGWDWRSEGGSTASDLPFERTTPHNDVAIESLMTQVAWSDDDQVVTVGGFVSLDVATVELVVGDSRVRVAPSPATGAYIAAALLPPEPTVDPEAIDVRAYASNGDLLDSTLRSRKRRQAGEPTTVSVAEATRLPDDTSVMIRGSMLVVDGEPVRLCDEVDASVEPPRPLGQSLIVDGLSAASLPKSWTPSRGAVALSVIVVRGTVSGGHVRLDRASDPETQNLN